MSLTHLSPLGFTLGLVAIAGGLVALQILRVRHDRVPVVTTLFWKEAVDEARARELWQRFRHPLAYLLALAIAGLAWLALAGPRSDAMPPGDLVLLLDADADQDPEAFAEARDALIERATDEARKATTVVWCGASTETLLAPGESIALLAPRLQDRQPDGVSGAVERALTELGHGQDDTRDLRVVVHAAGGIAPAVLSSLPDHVSVQLAADPADAAARPAVTRLGLAPAASGVWDVVDVIAEVRQSELKVTLDGTPMIPDERLLEDRDGASYERVVLRDVPSRGGRLVVTAGGAEGPRAERVLPDLRNLVVSLDGNVDSGLAAVLSADPAVTLVGDTPDVRVGGPGIPGPVLRVVPADAGTPAIRIEVGPDEDPEAVLAEVLGEFGLDRVDGGRLASELGRPLGIEVHASDARAVSLWADLLDPERCSFTQGRAFPVLVGRSVRWLAGVDPFPTEVALGEPVPARSGRFLEGEREIDSLGAAFVPAGVGDVRTEAGLWLTAAGLSHDLGPLDAAAGVVTADAPAGAGSSAVFWLLLIVLALLLTEWRLVRTGRMP